MKGDDDPIRLVRFDTLVRMVDELDAAQRELYDHLGPLNEQWKALGEFITVHGSIAALYTLRQRVQKEIERRVAHPAIDQQLTNGVN